MNVIETLEFEGPIASLLKEIDALDLLPATDARDREVASLRRRLDSTRADLYATLTPWQRVQVARHPSRPGLEEFIRVLFSGFVELHGDRRFADDHALMTGFADYNGQPVLLVGHVKGGDTKEKIYRNFGYARPEGYRKALRAMRLAEKFGRPIIVFVDTPAAYPGIEFTINAAVTAEDDLVKEPFTLKDGLYDIPDKPGLGVTLDEEAVEKYRVR